MASSSTKQVFSTWTLDLEGGVFFVQGLKDSAVVSLTEVDTNENKLCSEILRSAPCAGTLRRTLSLVTQNTPVIVTGCARLSRTNLEGVDDRCDVRNIENKGVWLTILNSQQSGLPIIRHPPTHEWWYGKPDDSVLEVYSAPLRRPRGPPEWISVASYEAQAAEWPTVMDTRSLLTTSRACRLRYPSFRAADQHEVKYPQASLRESAKFWRKSNESKWQREGFSVESWLEIALRPDPPAPRWSEEC